MFKKVFLVIGLILLMGIVQAQIQIGDTTTSTDRTINLQTPPTSIYTILNTTVINSSTFADIWITSEGDMDDVSDLFPTLDAVYCLLTGCTITGDLNVEGDVSFTGYNFEINSTQTTFNGNASFTGPFETECLHCEDGDTYFHGDGFFSGNVTAPNIEVMESLIVHGNSTCTGTATACGDIGTSGLCGYTINTGQRGCRWRIFYGDCVGTATPCEEMSTATCEEQHVCALTADVGFIFGVDGFTGNITFNDNVTIKQNLDVAGNGSFDWINANNINNSNHIYTQNLTVYDIAVLSGMTFDGNLDMNSNNITNTDWYFGKFNQSYGDDWQYLDTSTGEEYFNESKFATTYYNATQYHAEAGQDFEGDITYTQHPDGDYDGNTFNFSEQAGSPGLDLRINFTSVSDFNKGYMRYKTSSLSGDYALIQLWDYNDGEWEGGYGEVSDAVDEYFTIAGDILDSTDHIQDGVVQMRLYKSANGNTNNEYYVDMLAVVDGYATPSGNVDLTPYWRYDDTDEDRNFLTDGNVTGDWINSNNLNNSNHIYTQNLTVYDTTLLRNFEFDGNADFNDGNISVNNLTANNIHGLNTITASGQIQGEHLYSTDDAQIDNDLTVGGVFWGGDLYLNYITPLDSYVYISGANRRFDGFYYGSNTFAGAVFVGRKARGVAASPSVPNLDDNIANFQNQIWDGNAWRVGGKIGGKVNSASIDTTHWDTRIGIEVAKGTTLTEKVQIGYNNSKFMNNIQLTADDLKLSFGDDGDTFMFWDGSNFIVNTTSGYVHFLNNSGYASIYASSFEESSPEYEEGKMTLLSEMPDPSLIVKDEKSEEEFHDSYPEFVRGTKVVRDEDTCEDVYDYTLYCYYIGFDKFTGDSYYLKEEPIDGFEDNWDYFCEKVLPKGATAIHQEDFNKTICDTKEEPTIKLGNAYLDNYGLIYQMKQENDLMKASLCNLGETQWCK